MDLAASSGAGANLGLGLEPHLQIINILVDIQLFVYSNIRRNQAVLFVILVVMVFVD